MPGTPGPFLSAGATSSFTPSGGTLTAIAEIKSIAIPGFEVDDINVSTLASPKGANGDPWKQFIAGWTDGGVVEFECIFDPTNYTTLNGFKGKTGVLTVTLSNGSIFACPGYIKSLKTDNPLEEEVTGSFSFKVSGIPTFTA